MLKLFAKGFQPLIHLDSSCVLIQILERRLHCLSAGKFAERLFFFVGAYAGRCERGGRSIGGTYAGRSERDTCYITKPAIMYMCMYVCMYVCTYVCVCVYIYVCMYIHMCVCVCICIYMYIYVYMYIV